MSSSKKFVLKKGFDDNLLFNEMVTKGDGTKLKLFRQFGSK